MASYELDKILEGLGQSIGIDQLHLGEKNACLIKLAPDDLLVQIEPDKDEAYMLIASNVAQMPPGRYRETVFEAALRSNNIEPRLGTFAFTTKTDTLLLFDKIWTKGVHPQRFAEFFQEFVAKVRLWKDSIEHNQIPPIAGLSGVSRPGGVFGLHS